MVLKACFLRSLSTAWGNVRDAHFWALIQTYSIVNQGVRLRNILNRAPGVILKHAAL